MAQNWIAISTIDGSDLGDFTSKGKALAAEAAYDTTGRKAAYTKSLTGAAKAAGIKAAATRAARAAA